MQSGLLPGLHGEGRTSCRLRPLGRGGDAGRASGSHSSCAGCVRVTRLSLPGRPRFCTAPGGFPQSPRGSRPRAPRLPSPHPPRLPSPPPPPADSSGPRAAHPQPPFLSSPRLCPVLCLQLPLVNKTSQQSPFLFPLFSPPRATRGHTGDRCPAQVTGARRRSAAGLVWAAPS